MLKFCTFNYFINIMRVYVSSWRVMKGLVVKIGQRIVLDCRDDFKLWRKVGNRLVEERALGIGMKIDESRWDVELR